MGFFSFLKRKNGQPDDARATRARAGEPSRLSDTERLRQREIARATAAKIDAIELEMASDIFNDAEPAWGSVPRRAPAAATVPQSAPGAPDNIGSGDVRPVADPAPPPVAQEAALLYAAGQAQDAERALRASLIGAGRSERLPWWMLFDLYQVSGREQEFESIAIDYAIHFETSPPAWRARAADNSQRQFAGITPTEAFSGVLQQPQLQRLLASGSPVVRLEFGGVRGATPDGCQLLLDGLATLRSHGTELVLAGADNLVAVLRPMLAIGERGASPAPWLLLLELLRLTDREKDFEETAMDYRVTFEADPPRFEAPAKVATSAAGGERPAANASAGDRFMLPPVVSADCSALLAEAESYARTNDPAVLDCSRLARLEHDAASALEGQLRALALEGRKLELREVNNLVAPLLRLVGAGDSARLFTTKY